MLNDSVLWSKWWSCWTIIAAYRPWAVYVQAGQGRTYAEKVDAGPLVAYLHLQTFSSFGGFQVFKFWERESSFFCWRGELSFFCFLFWSCIGSQRDHVAKHWRERHRYDSFRFRATATNQKQSRFESTANYSSQQGQNAELCTALEESCAGDTSTARDRDLCLLRIVVV